MTLAVFAVGAALSLLIVIKLAGGSLEGRPNEKVLDSPRPDSPERLVLGDPLAAVQQYGVPEDYERLAEQGVDLRGLGYEPPGES